MARGQPVALQRCRPKLSLEIDHSPFDLDGKDLLRSPQHHVDCLAVLAGENLELNAPRARGHPSQAASDLQLSVVPQPWPATRIRPHDQIQTDGIGDGDQSAERD